LFESLVVLVIEASHFERQAPGCLGDLIAGPLQLVVKSQETRLVGVVRQQVQLLSRGFQSLIKRLQHPFEMSSLGEVITLWICGVAKRLCGTRSFGGLGRGLERCHWFIVRGQLSDVSGQPAMATGDRLGRDRFRGPSSR
jgi:hypothetical protein